jgi:Rieske Fe-S protein
MGSTVAGGAIRCAKHGAEFDLVTGKPRNGVTPRTLKIYPLKVEQGRILVGAAPGVTAPGDAATTPGAKPVAGS